MDLDDSTTITKIVLRSGRGYLMIEWQADSFDMYLYTNGNLWKGKFSPNRLTSFSKNMHITEHAYFSSLKQCLSQQRDDCRYELINGFFYWRPVTNNSIVKEGFLPMEKDTSPPNLQPNLVEILLAKNTQLKEKANNLKCKFQTIKTDYLKCLKDTEEFLNLKIVMEKALCDKFLNLILKNSNMEVLTQNEAIDYKEDIAKKTK